MRAHDGLLIVALLLIAAAVGCRKDSSSRHKAHNTPAGKVVVHNHPPKADGEAGGVKNGAATPATKTSDRAEPPEPTPAESTQGLAEARRELGEIADGALSLRAALLGAEFAEKKDPNAAKTTPREATHDHR
ncbi:MAG: hypothetical protein ACLFV7_11790 [Phycisphaerae bacterium]